MAQVAVGKYDAFIVVIQLYISSTILRFLSINLNLQYF